MSDEIQPSAQGYRSMREEGGATDGAPVPGNAASAGNVLELTAGSLAWEVAKYRSRFGRMLDARRFGGIFLDARSRLMVDSRGPRQDTDIGAKWCLYSVKRHRYDVRTTGAQRAWR